MSDDAFVFTKDTKISEALELSEAVAAKFKELGLKCVECAANEKETLYFAAIYHEKDLKVILEELNKLGIKKPGDGGSQADGTGA